jgi:uncharacterized protein DUF2017
VRPFRRDGDVVVMELEDFEVDLLRSLPQAVRAVLDDPDPEDPVVTRLFPQAVHGDDDADGELRRLLYDDLLRDRLVGLDALIDVLDRGSAHRGRLRVRLVEDEPALVLGVLNDFRLTLGTRIGVELIDREGLDDDDPTLVTLRIMDHLAWLQVALLRVVDPESVGVEDDAIDPDMA